MNLLTALKKTAAENQAAITFVSSVSGPEVELTYAALYEISSTILGALQARGMKAGDELIIQTDSNRDFLCLFWGCMLGGIIPVPLSGGTLTGQKLKFFQVWKCLSNPYIACEAAQLERLKSVSADDAANAGCFQQMQHKYFDIPGLFLHTEAGTEAAVSAGDIAYIQFSSGSTGMPKGVCLTHQNLAANVQDISDSLHISESDKLFNWMPLTHDMGIIGFHLLGVWRGLNAVSMDTSLLIRRPLSWMDLVSAQKATVLYAPNFGFQYFINALKPDGVYNWHLSCIRIIVNGAEPISAELCTKFTETLSPFGLHANAIVPAYGLAESSVEVSAAIPGEPLHSHHLNRKKLAVGDEVEMLPEASAETVSFVETGKVAASCFVRISNDNGAVLPEKTIGHIQITGANVTRGYYNNPAATENIFTPDGWLKTGDLGFMINNRLVVTGRLKNIIIVNGQNYYPQDIEKCIVNACGLEPGKVVACGTGGSTHLKEELLIFVLYKSSPEAFQAISESIRQAVFSQIGIRVDRVIPVTKIPKTTSGKIRYFELVEHYLGGAFDAKAQERPIQTGKDVPVNDDLPAVQALIMKELAVLTGNKHLPGNADFFDFGMNSLTAMQFAEKISRLTGRHITVNDVFTCHSVPLLSQYICSAAGNRQLPVMCPVPVVHSFALSPAQKRLFTEYLLNKTSSAYNIPVVFTIEGNFNCGYMKRALRKVVSRYEILRTSFRMEGNAPRQEVHEFRDDFAKIRQVDLTAVTDRDAEAERLIAAEANRPFILEQPAQHRVSEILLGNERRVLVFVIHHIITDGWSLELIFHELFTIYNHLAGGTDVQLNAPAFQFRDYIFWQQELLASDAVRKDCAYWRDELKELPDPVELCVSSASSSVTGHISTGRYSTVFQEPALEKLGVLSKKYGVSPFTLLLSLLNALIYRYTNQRDITVGFDSAMRFTEELQRLPGYTLNTLCLRTAVQPEMPFRELAAAVHHKLMQALDHQLYPFEKILEDVYSGNNRLGNPLFSILVLFQNFYHEELPLNIQGCTFSRKQAAVSDGFTDILMEFNIKEQAPELHIHYNEARYTVDEMARFAQHLEILLHKVYADDTGPLGKYEFLTPAEKQLLLAGPGDFLTAEMEHLPVHVLFEQQVRISPEKTAVYSGGKSLSYRALNERANAVAHYLVENCKLSAGACVGFMVSRSEKIPIAMLGILKAGCVYVAIDAEYPAGRCRQIAADSNIRRLLTGHEIKQALQDHFDDGFLVDMDEEHFHSVSLPDPAYNGSLNDLAYIIYTSGSTGHPKGVMTEHASLTQYVQQFSRYFGITQSDIFLQQASPAFDTIVEEIFPALCSSGAIVIAPGGGRATEEMPDLIRLFGVTVLSTTPLVLNEINRTADDRIDSLRLIISGGDVLHPYHINRLLPGKAVYNTYGPSEATVCATYHKVTSPDDAGKLGRPVEGRFIYIVDENNEPLPFGRAGEICIEGGLARGYLNQPALTQAVFVRHPAGKSNKVYRTGDRGYITEEGEIIFLGRADDQLKLNGHRIEPAEIEKLICTYTGVDAAVVIPDREKRYLAACIVVNEAYSEGELQLFMDDRMPYYMVPRRICVFEKLPVTKTGKTDRKQLQEWLWGNDPEPDNVYAAPVTKMEQAVTAIWEEVLGRQMISVTDNFFVIGGDSLRANQLVNEIYNRLLLEISLIDVFKHATIRQISAVLSSIEQEHYEFIDLA